MMNTSTGNCNSLRIVKRGLVAIMMASPLLFAADIVVDFEELPFGEEPFVIGDATGAPLVSRGVAFARPWLDGFAGGWYYSRATDLITPGFMNPYSAYALPSGGGVDGSSNFGVAFDIDGSEANIALPQPARVDGMYITNTTYAYLATVNGDDGAGFVKGPFEDGDWFRLDITGQDRDGQPVGSVEFYLADYRNGNSFAAADWMWLDLSSLGDNVSSLRFDLSSTDIGMFGMNTPAYFAMDNLTITIPEPTSPTIAALAALLMTTWQRPRRLPR